MFMKSTWLTVKYTGNAIKMHGSATIHSTLNICFAKWLPQKTSIYSKSSTIMYLCLYFSEKVISEFIFVSLYDNDTNVILNEWYYI